jgi:hypothetical protein
MRKARKQLQGGFDSDSSHSRQGEDDGVEEKRVEAAGAEGLPPQALPSPPNNEESKSRAHEDEPVAPQENENRRRAADGQSDSRFREVVDPMDNDCEPRFELVIPLQGEIASELEVYTFTELNELVDDPLCILNVREDWYCHILGERKFFKHFTRTINKNYIGRLIAMRLVLERKEGYSPGTVAAFIVLGEEQDSPAARRDLGRDQNYKRSYPIRCLIKLDPLRCPLRLRNVHEGTPAFLPEELCGETRAILRQMLMPPAGSVFHRPDLLSEEMVRFRALHRRIAASDNKTWALIELKEMVPEKIDDQNLPQDYKELMRGDYVPINNGDEKEGRNFRFTRPLEESDGKVVSRIIQAIQDNIGLAPRRGDLRLIKTEPGDPRDDERRNQDFHTDFCQNDQLEDAMRWGYAPITFLVGLKQGSRLLIMNMQPDGNLFLDEDEFQSQKGEGGRMVDLKHDDRYFVLLFRPNCIHAGAGLAAGVQVADVRLFGRLIPTATWHFSGELPGIYGSGALGLTTLAIPS